MAFSESIAARTRHALSDRKGVIEKKMFGSLCFLLNGNLLVGVWGYSLIARLGPDQAGTALQKPHVKKFDVTGKPMKGWVLVEPNGVENDEQLKDWIQAAMEFVGTLPRK